jgi:hypothetical protein
MCKHERPRPGAGGAVDDPRQDHPTVPLPVYQETQTAGPVPVRDKLLWGWDDIAALTGLSRRLLEQQVSARRMPGPDIRVGRRALWRPATITAWLESLAQQAPGRKGRA